jgi:hypothetical protein
MFDPATKKNGSNAAKSVPAFLSNLNMFQSISPRIRHRKSFMLLSIADDGQMNRQSLVRKWRDDQTQIP